MGLLSDENLPLEWTEFSFCAIIDDGSWGLADFAVWQDDRGWNDPLILVVFNDHP